MHKHDGAITDKGNGIVEVDLDAYLNDSNATTTNTKALFRVLDSSKDKIKSTPVFTEFASDIFSTDRTIGNLIVDEVTLLSPATLYALSLLGAAKNNNSLIFYNGDFNQASYVY